MVPLRRASRISSIAARSSSSAAAARPRTLARTRRCRRRRARDAATATEQVPRHSPRTRCDPAATAPSPRGSSSRDAAEAACVTFRRDRQRRFTALQEDVLRRETAVVARAQRDLSQNAVLRIALETLLDQRFEFSRCKRARLPIVAFVGLRRRYVQPVVDETCKRVSEKRQVGRAAILRIGRNEQPRVSRRQHRRERVSFARRSDRRQRVAAG